MATTLGNMAVGSTVKIKENGVAQEYLIVHQGIPTGTVAYDSSCNGTWLLRKNADFSMVQYDIYASIISYETSTAHNWLNTTFLSMLDQSIQASIKQVKIPYLKNGYTGTVYSGETGLPCKIFYLSAREIGSTQGENFSPIDGNILSYFSFDGNSDAWLKRRAGNALPWITRSLSNMYSDRAWVVESYGELTALMFSTYYNCRPAMVFPVETQVDDSGNVFVNTSPSVPSSISVPSTITDGDTITVSWGAASDAEGNLSGYKLEKSTNGGGSWSQIYQGSARSKTDTISGITQVMYRVKAYDSAGLESGYRTSSNVSIRFKPTTPSSISVPSEINDGQEVIITWGASTDTNGNLSGYKLEKSTNGGTQWSQIYQGANLSYTDTVSGVSQVCYRVKAYDSTNLESGYATSQNVAVNRYPLINCDFQNNSSLGTKTEDFVIQYNITDADNNTVAVTETIDGAQHRIYTATLGKQNTFDISGLTFMKLSNGEHTLQIIANDGKVSTTYTLTFIKSVTGASVTLKSGIVKSTGKITTCYISISGNIPSDADLTVEVTNNANDPDPIWEDCTASVKSDINYLFMNKTAKAGFAFNFKVSVERGDSDTGGYITKVSGKFA